MRIHWEQAGRYCSRESASRERTNRLSLATLASYFQRNPFRESFKTRRKLRGPGTLLSARDRGSSSSSVSRNHRATSQTTRAEYALAQTIEWLRDAPNLRSPMVKRDASQPISSGRAESHTGLEVSKPSALRRRVGARHLEHVPKHSAARAPTRCVQGRDLIERGLRPGPKFAAICRACRQIQDDDGIKDVDQLIDRVLLAKGA